MTKWYLVIDGVCGTPEEWGVSRGLLRFVANGFDTLTLDIFPEDAAGLMAELVEQGAPPPDSVPHDAAVELRRGSSAASATVFAGYVDAMELVADATSGLLQRYTVRNVLAKLEKTPYTWEKTAFTSEGVEATFNDSCVILGQTSQTNKARLTTGGQIAQILGYAKQKWSLAYDVHEEVASRGFQFPLDQRENITCWDGIVACLRWMPDHVLWCDYTDGVTVRLMPQSALSSTTISLLGGAVSDFRASPRHDLQCAGVRCNFRKSHTENGTTREYRYVQTAGNYEAHNALDLYIDLEGSSRTTESQAVKSVALPSFSSPNATSVRNWLVQHTPWLSDVTRFTIKSVTRTPDSTSRPNELVGGNVGSWMSHAADNETITFSVEYVKLEQGAVYGEKSSTDISVRCVTTDAPTGSYTRTMSYQTGESVPTGLASGLYSAWGVLHWDGSLSVDFGVVGLVKPGGKLNVSGSTAALAAMGAIIQTSEVSLFDDSLRVSFGTSRRLEADSMIALYRATRTRKPAWENEMSSSSDGKPPDKTPDSNTIGSPSFKRSVVWSENDQEFEDEIMPRDIGIIVFDEVTGRPMTSFATVMCGEPWGPTEPLGGGGKYGVRPYFKDAVGTGILPGTKVLTHLAFGPEALLDSLPVEFSTDPDEDWSFLRRPVDKDGNFLCDYDEDDNPVDANGVALYWDDNEGKFFYCEGADGEGNPLVGHPVFKVSIVPVFAAATLYGFEGTNTLVADDQPDPDP